MRGYLYVFEDVLAEQYAPPSVYPTDGVAARAFLNMKFPPGSKKGEFRLWRVGSFDGLSVDSWHPEVVATYGDYVPSEVEVLNG